MRMSGSGSGAYNVASNRKLVLVDEPPIKGLIGNGYSVQEKAWKVRSHREHQPAAHHSTTHFHIDMAMNVN